MINSITKEKEKVMISHTERWENEYSEIDGDERALGWSCDESSGSEASYPNDEKLIRNGAKKTWAKFYRTLDKIID